MMEELHTFTACMTLMKYHVVSILQSHRVHEDGKLGLGWEATCETRMPPGLFSSDGSTTKGGPGLVPYWLQVPSEKVGLGWV